MNENITILVQVSIQQSFATEVTCKCRSDTLDDTRATPYSKMPPSEVVNAYKVSQYVIQPLSLDLSLGPPLVSPEEREELPAHS
jgi:hypothetical protein